MAVILDNEHILRKAVQLGVSFMPSLDADADKEKLIDFARAVRVGDAKVFNKYSLDTNAPSGLRAVLLFERDIPLRGVGQVHHCPLIIFPNSMEVGLIYRVPEATTLEIDGQDYPDDTGFPKQVLRPILRHFWDKITHVDIVRIGKVYEYQYGPFEEEDALKWLLANFVKAPKAKQVAAANAFLLFQEHGMNINLAVSSARHPNGSVILVKLDINNIDTTRKLQMNDFDAIMSAAGEFHKGGYQEILKETTQ
jgi:hypothetical protein